MEAIKFNDLHQFFVCVCVCATNSGSISSTNTKI